MLRVADNGRFQTTRINKGRSFEGVPRNSARSFGRDESRSLHGKVATRTCDTGSLRLYPRQLPRAAATCPTLRQVPVACRIGRRRPSPNKHGG